MSSVNTTEKDPENQDKGQRHSLSHLANEEVAVDAKATKRLGSGKLKIAVVFVVEPLLVFILIGFWVSRMLDIEEVEDDSEENEEEQALDVIQDNHRFVSLKKRKKVEGFFHMVTVLLSVGIILGNAALAFDKKNKMAACLLWLFIHFWWILVCLLQFVRAVAHRFTLFQMSSEIADDPKWIAARNEVLFVIVYYFSFMAVDVVFVQVVRYRFLFLRKEDKLRHQNATKRYMLSMRKRRIVRLRQKEMFYQREEGRRKPSELELAQSDTTKKDQPQI